MSEARTDRHDPTGGDDYISIQHVERYRFACQKLKPGSRVLDGRYTSVLQAIGTKPQNTALKAAAEQFLAEARESGMVAELIEKHGVKGKLQVSSGA